MGIEFVNLDTIEIIKEKVEKRDKTSKRDTQKVNNKKKSKKVENKVVDKVINKDSTGIGVLSTVKIETKNELINIKQQEAEVKRQEDIKEILGKDLEFPYKRIELLTNAELQLFHFMENNLCQIDRIRIFPKVRLADIISIDERMTTNKDYLWKITNKHVDFLICEKNELKPICVVELDDYTHSTDQAKEKDVFVMQALSVAKIQTIRIRTSIRNISKKDLSLVDYNINLALAPKCPSCGKRMLPKENKKDGNKFYACEDFINCRATINIDPKGVQLP